MKQKRILVAPGLRDTKEGFCSWKVVTWLLEMETLTMLSVYPVWKKDLLKKNNILFKWCNTLALSGGQIETPWVTETQPCPLLAWKYRTIRWIVGGGRMGRSGNMLMFTEQSLSLQLTVTETLIKVSRYHALSSCFPGKRMNKCLLTYQLCFSPTSKQCNFFPLCVNSIASLPTDLFEENQPLALEDYSLKISSSLYFGLNHFTVTN